MIIPLPQNAYLRAGLYLLGLLLLAALILPRIFPNDRRAIEKMLRQLEASIQMPEKTGLLANVQAGQAFGKFFTENASCTAGEPFNDIIGRSNILARMVQLRQQLNRLSVDIRGMEIELGPNKGEARAALSGEANASYGSQTYREYREFDLKLTQQDGTWRISKVRLAESIQRPEY